MEDFPFPKWVAWIGIVAFAMLGGAVGHTTREQQSGRRITFRGVVFQSFASGFVGILVILLALEWGVSLLWAGFLAGVLGFLGVMTAMGIFNKIVALRHSIEMPDSKGTGQ